MPNRSQGKEARCGPLTSLCVEVLLRVQHSCPVPVGAVGRSTEQGLATNKQIKRCVA